MRKLMLSLVLLQGMLLWLSGCGQRAVEIDRARSPLRPVGATPPSQVEPGGKSEVCVNSVNEICGPFADDLRRLCAENGGGDPCQSDRWDRRFYEGLARELGRANSGATVPTPSTPTSPSGALGGLIVAIDVGHGMFSENGGGFDPGAVNKSNREITEHRENWRQAKVAEALLSSWGAEVRVYAHELGSPKLSLREKGALSAGAHVFVSMHKNSYKSWAQGTETWISKQATGSDVLLAEKIQSKMVEMLWPGKDDSYNRGVKRENWSVLMGVPSSVEASVLLEAYFIHVDMTEDEAARMSEISGEAAAHGIADYWKSRGSSVSLLSLTATVCDLMPLASGCRH